jgi:O-6-methylguanine DNA methyltransferase
MAPDHVVIRSGMCNVGHYSIVCSMQGLVAISLADSPIAAHESIIMSLWKGAVVATEGTMPSAWFEAAEEILCGGKAPYPYALDVRGTPFQLEVWRQLLMIPYGTVTTYSALAMRLGGGSHVRAVATAVAKNPCAVVIPCHRVLGRDGRLHGFRWGLERKHGLLAREGVATV